jgi:hypothetical protein
MISFAFTSDDLKTAPAEVRQWVLAHVEADLAALAAVAPPTPAHAPTLAACTPEEAVRLFELLNGDFPTTRVLIELARETPFGEATAPYHAISLGNLMRHTRLEDSALISCLNTINRAFQQVRRDPEATLFGFDQANHVYIHQETRRSIHNLWQELVQTHVAPTRDGQGHLFGFGEPNGLRVRQLGPSENIGAHREP